MCRYARAYMGIQFFDSDSLLPPPFTFLSVLVLAFQKCNERRVKRYTASNEAQVNDGMKQTMELNGADQIYPQLIFQLIDNAKPRPDGIGKKSTYGGG